MNLLREWIVILGLGVFLSSCSLMEEFGHYKDSALSNNHPAPQSVSVPQTMGEDFKKRSRADYHFTLGESFSLEGKTTKAIEEFKQTLIYDPNSSTVRMRLAAEFLKLGMFSEALEQSQKSVELNPKDVDARLLLAGLYSSVKLFDRALEHYELLRVQNPENLNVQLLIGVIYFEKGRQTRAKSIFKELLVNSKFEKKELAYMYLAKLALTNESLTTEKRIREAEKMLKKSIEADPSFIDGVQMLTQLYEANGETQKAIALLESFQAKFGPKPSLSHRLSRYYLEKKEHEKAIEQLEYLEGFEPDNLNVKVKKSLVYIETKQFTKAVQSLEEILRVAPDSDKIRFYLGAVYEELKKFDVAIHHFSKILSNSSYYNEAMIHQSYLYKEKGDFNQAQRTIQLAIETKPEVVQFYSFYVALLDENKKYKDADRMLTDAVKKFPESSQLRFFLGSIKDKLGDKGQAIEEMKVILSQEPQHVEALNYLAYLYAERGENLKEAEILARKALSLSPGDGYILDTVGWVLYKKGQYKDSVKYLEKAHDKKKDESIIAEHLGDAYYKNQLIDKARRMYIHASKYEKDKDKVKKIKSKIDATYWQRTQPRLPASAK